MQLTDQVANLELSRRLKEIGVKQKSIFVWYTNGNGAQILYLGEDGMRPIMESKTYSAFTASELGEMLPVGFQVKKFEDRWICELTVGNLNHIKIGDTLVGAIAKMLVYLIEKGLVKV